MLPRWKHILFPKRSYVGAESSRSRRSRRPARGSAGALQPVSLQSSRPRPTPARRPRYRSDSSRSLVYPSSRLKVFDWRCRLREGYHRRSPSSIRLQGSRPQALPPFSFQARTVLTQKPSAQSMTYDQTWGAQLKSRRECKYYRHLGPFSSGIEIMDRPVDGGYPNISLGPGLPDSPDRWRPCVDPSLRA
jgi:hypothetical protein